MANEIYELQGQIFEWDREKHLANIRKHGVTFKMAAKSFLDPDAVKVDDDYHSQDEDRFIVIGKSEADKILTVCHCFRDREDKEIVRIISARLASKSEQKIYKEDKL